MESAVNYPILNDPSFMRRMDLRMSFRRDAEVCQSYCPPRLAWQTALDEPLPEKNEDAPLVMFQSATHNRSRRIEYAVAIMSMIRTDSYGRVLNNRQLAHTDRGVATKLDTIRRYKFCLCLENALELDYVTEKFYEALLVGTVPVYRGAPNIQHFAPGENSFINAADFSGPAELCTYLASVSRDESAYHRFLEWRQKPLSPSFQRHMTTGPSEAFAKLIETVKRRMA